MNNITPIIIVWQTLLGHYRLHRAQGLFLLIGLSLGVAILLGTLLLNHAATNAFERAESTLNGQIIATIIPTNGAKTFDEEYYLALRKKGYSKLMPVLEGTLVLDNGKQLHLKGIDIFANLNRDFGPVYSASQEQKQQSTQQQTPPIQSMAFSFPPYQLLVAQSQAKLLGLSQGQQLRSESGLLLPKISIISDDLGVNYELMCDIRAAQSILSQTDKLSNLIITSKSTNQQQLKEDLAQITKGELTLKSNSKNPESQSMAEAFFLNITAVSMLAFLVGCFIAFNAVRFSIDERLKLVQKLRLLGVSNRSLMVALMLELLAWAILASIIGGIAGFIIADSLSAGVGLTTKQLFGGANLIAVNTVSHWWLQAVTISLIATTLATAGPFYQLYSQKPLANAEQHSTGRWQWLLGLTLLTIGCLLTLAPHSQNLGFAITFCWFLGGALLVPKVLSINYSLLSKFPNLKSYPKLHWAIEDGRQNPQRLSIAMMAFTVAIGASISVNTMVSSFRHVLESHLDLVLAEDIYLSPRDEQSEPIYNYLTNHQSVALAYRFLTTQTQVKKHHSQQQMQQVSVRTISDHPLRHNSINLEQTINTRDNDFWRQFHQRQGVIINQTMALQFNLNTGDDIAINYNPNQQPVQTKVLGIYYNYGSPKSAIAISHQWFKALWPQVKNSEIGVFVSKNQADTQQTAKLIEQLKAKFNLQSSHYIEPQGIKHIALTIFEQTFNVTQLLIVFTLIIAAIGIYCACYAAQLNNLRQLTLLKILGVNQRQLVGLSILQLGFNTTIAALIAIPLGLIIAWASVTIVLQYSFGWHFPILIEQQLLLIIATGAIFIGVTAGAIPLYQQSRKTAIDAFREAV